jgi:trans-2,3-dihydro-3-hydroxyanthranilate isomerase
VTGTPALGPEPLWLPFAFVDVFATAPLTGNPLAVVGGGDAITDDQMRRVAREFNQAETTFVLTPRTDGADWHLRSFTAAGVEVYGAGHNALGAWWWLAAAGHLKLSSERTVWTQELGSAVLAVEIRSDGGRPSSIAMAQEPPTFGRRASESDRAALAAALRLDATDVGATATHGAELPAQVVSTGTSHLMVPLRNRAAIARARPDAEALVAVLTTLGAEGCYLASLDPVSPHAVAHARFFNPAFGLDEDIATGTAAGPLACHLRAHGLIEDGATVIIEQGHALGRPSELRVTVTGERVVLSGTAVISAEGMLRVA